MIVRLLLVAASYEATVTPAAVLSTILPIPCWIASVKVATMSELIGIPTCSSNGENKAILGAERETAALVKPTPLITPP